MNGESDVCLFCRARQKGDRKRIVKDLSAKGMMPSKVFDYKVIDFSSFQGGSQNMTNQVNFEQATVRKSTSTSILSTYMYSKDTFLSSSGLQISIAFVEEEEGEDAKKEESKIEHINWNFCICINYMFAIPMHASAHYLTIAYLRTNVTKIDAYKRCCPFFFFFSNVYNKWHAINIFSYVFNICTCDNFG